MIPLLKPPTHVEEMEFIRCGNPDCLDPACSQVLVLTPLCHPRAGVHAEYHKADGTLRCACQECHRPIISFKVATLPQERKQ